MKIQCIFISYSIKGEVCKTLTHYQKTACLV